MSDTRRYLMSYFGTFFSYDNDTRELCHRPLGENDPRFSLIYIDRLEGWPTDTAVEATNILRGFDEIDPSALLAGLAVLAGSDSNVAHFSRNGKFLTSIPNHKFEINADVCREWERFLLVSSDDIVVLNHILRHAWQIQSTGAVVKPGDARIIVNNVVRLGDARLHLLQNTPLARCLDHDILTFFLPDGRCEYARRVDASAVSAPVVAADLRPLIWIQPLGNTGNRALQYLVAHGICRHVPAATIENIHLPEWGRVDRRAPPPMTGAATLGKTRYWIDVPGLGNCLRRGVIKTLIIDAYCFNLEHYPPRQEARKLLPAARDGATAEGFGPGDLVCSVRGAEILKSSHPDYVVLPPEYYRMLAERSGLNLVFYGQLGDDPYSQSLREKVPEARFVPGRNPGYDFEVLRRSVNIAPSVSTFAWLAAWLSEAEKVYLPVAGMFSPVQHPLQMYLPLDDPGFEYTLFPFAKMANVWQRPEDFQTMQDVLAHHARPVGAEELRGICARAAAFAPRQPLVGGFDPDHYLANYPDVTDEIERGNCHSALDHYLRTGFRKGWSPVEFNSRYYATTYPDAAMAIAEGHYSDPLHHYTAVGWTKGYRPTPG